MKKQRTPTPPQKLITVEMTYKVKCHKDIHPYTYITFTIKPKHKAFKAIKKEFKKMYKEIGCKMLTCKVTSYLDRVYEEELPKTFTKALEVFI